MLDESRPTFTWKNFSSVLSVVSTIVSGIIFARFPTVECITNGANGCSFLLWCHSCSKKVPVDKSGGKGRFSLSFLSSRVNDIRRKLYMVGTYSTVWKGAKRMPNIRVETTLSLFQLLKMEENENKLVRLEHWLQQNIGQTNIQVTNKLKNLVFEEYCYKTKLSGWVTHCTDAS